MLLLVIAYKLTLVIGINTQNKILYRVIFFEIKFYLYCFLLKFKKYSYD